jgi:hypothetical protein
MGRPYACNGSEDLCGDVAGGHRPRQFSSQCEGDAHGRIEMRAGKRPEDQDQHGQNRACRYGVAQQRERDVSAGEPLGHDAGADDRRQQERGAQPFRKDTPRQ